MRASIRTLPFVLIVTTAVPSVSAQTLACYPIRSGDTAARLARQLTGRADNRHQAWFQIVEPASQTVISKRNYSRLQAGWHVCVATERMRGFSVPSVLRATATTSPGLVPQPAANDWPILWWAMLLSLTCTGAFTWVSTSRYLDRRQLLVRVHDSLRAAIRGRVRAAAVSQSACRRGEPLAPATCPQTPATGDSGRSGKRLNVSDSRRSSIESISSATPTPSSMILDDGRFVNAPLYSEGDWVVIPFHMAPQQVGGP